MRKEVKKIEALGVTFITQCMVGQTITVDDMFEQGFDAVFIGSGTALPKSLDTPGYTLRGVTQSSYFLRMASLCNTGSIGREEVPVKRGDIVGVIGGGNVAMDAARTALRMGAGKVYVLSKKASNFYGKPQLPNLSVLTVNWKRSESKLRKVKILCR